MTTLPLLLPGGLLCAQAGPMVKLPGHHPRWANEANDAGALAADRRLDGLTLVLARPEAQEAALKQLLIDQQDETSAEFRHWLTPIEFGRRFGVPASEVAQVKEWLKASGLRVSWVSPGGNFVGFDGTAAEVGRAFHTEMHGYRVHGLDRVSAASDPMIPAGLAGVIRSVRGLYTIEDRPMHAAGIMTGGKSSAKTPEGKVSQEALPSPQLTLSNGVHLLTPGDFDTIYDVSGTASGSGQTIGIVGRSRIDPDDISHVQNLALSSVAEATEVVPTGFGGIDPGPAYTAPPPEGVSLGDQLEATLDVLRAGSVAPLAEVLLVVATDASGGIGVDAQYLVQTTPVPAEVMNISFGECESAAGLGGVTFWDELFQQGAAEGISVFVSAGDSGASGCDQDFSTPPASPVANSPNYICSSSYATCVGGTEFADSNDPGQYWSTSNNQSLSSALGYIPEGAWNEPLNSKSLPQVASGGGGVSQVIATPSWQTGVGVPAARAGRYTPDVAFSASAHDGYFACFAAAGASCVPDAEGNYEFEYVFGTSAAAPSMAGITSLLNEQLQTPLGNLNPELYKLAATSPGVFHDVTVATSGVASCSLDTPSMCNTSIPGPTGLSGGQAGYLVTTGYDEATGLGSLDVAKFLAAYNFVKLTPTVTLKLSPATGLTTAEVLTVTVTVTGAPNFPVIGTVTLNGGAFDSGYGGLVDGVATLSIPAGQLPVGTDTITATFNPDYGTYASATGMATVAVTKGTLTTPTVTVTPSLTTITTAQQTVVSVKLTGVAGSIVPTGTVTLSSGSSFSYSTNVPTTGVVTFDVAGLAVPVGTDTLNAVYTPDAGSASIYTSASGSATVKVTAAVKVTPVVTVSASPTPVVFNQPINVVITVTGPSGDVAPSGTVVVSGGGYTSSAVYLGVGSTSVTIPGSALAIGKDTLTVSYTPDSGSAPIYNASSGSAVVVVTLITPALNVTTSSSTITSAQGLNASVTLYQGDSTLAAVTGTVTLSSGSFTASTSLMNQTATFAIPAGALAVGTDTLTAVYMPDAASAQIFTSITGTGMVTVTQAAPPSFTVTGPPIMVQPGATTGNSTTVTVTPSGGFTGSVVLTAVVTSSPAGAVDGPGLSFGASSPVTISGTGAATATLTITTTAATTSSLVRPAVRGGGVPWSLGGGASLACLLLVGARRQRRRLLGGLGALMLLATLAGGVMACGGGGSGTHAPGNPGTTAGTYVVTVTATSGATTANGTLTLTVD